MTAHDLARRAVACKGWRWLPGMRYLVYREDGLLIGAGFVQDDSFSNPLAVPCMPHPATIGCLLALVREAWGCDWLTCQPLLTAGGVHGWRVAGTSAQSGPTEAEALVAALEAVP